MLNIIYLFNILGLVFEPTSTVAQANDGVSRNGERLPALDPTFTRSPESPFRNCPTSGHPNLYPVHDPVQFSANEQPERIRLRYQSLYVLFLAKRTLSQLSAAVRFIFNRIPASLSTYGKNFLIRLIAFFLSLKPCNYFIFCHYLRFCL